MHAQHIPVKGTVDSSGGSKCSQMGQQRNERSHFRASDSREAQGQA